MTDLDQTNSNLRKQIEDYTNIVEQSKEITVGDDLLKCISFFSDIFMFLSICLKRAIMESIECDSDDDVDDSGYDANVL